MNQQNEEHKEGIDFTKLDVAIQETAESIRTLTDVKMRMEEVSGLLKDYFYGQDRAKQIPVSEEMTEDHLRSELINEDNEE